MKKLMIALAAAATTMLSFGAASSFEVSGTSFEGYPTNILQTAKGDSGNVNDTTTFWYTADQDAENIISNYYGFGETDPKEIPIASRPDYFAPSNNTKFLQLETTGKLFRSAKPNDQTTGFTPVEIPDQGIYLDTLVKFTAADDVFGADALESDIDKIAIEYVEREDDDTTSEINEALTNFVIRAGYLGSPRAVTNYLAAVPATFDKDAWHRLTVRSFSSIDNNVNPEDCNVGFVVYLDGEPLQYDTEEAARLGFAVDAGPNFTAAGEASAFYTESKRALFPSAVAPRMTNGKAISAVAFSGNGSIDDVVFTSNKPEFIRRSEAVHTEITLGTGISSVIVKVGKGDDELVINPEDAAANPLIYNLPAGTTNFTLTVTADAENGYSFAGLDGATYTDGNVTWTTPTPSFTVLASRNNVTYIDGDDQQQSCPSLATAFANAKSGTTITLAYDVDAADTEDAGFEGYTISSKSVVLDLNGQTITWTDSEGTGESLFNIVTGASLTVIDSSASNTGKIVYGGEYGAFNNGGECYVGAASGDYGPTIEGILYAVVDDSGPSVVRGKFDKVSNSTEDETPTFIGAADYIEAGSELKESLGDYWVVEPTGGSTTFALTTTGGANATITTSPANVSALTEATEVIITATPNTDYTYTGVTIDGWTLDSETGAISKTLTVSEDTEVAVPDAVSEQSQEDWPEGQDLIAAEGKAAGDLFPGITNALATADAKAVATWAEANKVAYADKGSILPEAFLLNCANTQAAIDEAAANFKITAITVAGDTVTITPADGADYGNGKVVIEGTATLSPISWHEKTDGDHFFRATLVVKPVAVP